MVLLLSGCSHTGKTALAQRLLEQFHLPYLSIDHLKMGLIRSGQTSLTPEDDEQLTAYLWPIVREIARTAIKNRQNLVIEGCYIPFDWRKDFSPEELQDLHCCFLIMSEPYIRSHFSQIMQYANIIEQRLDDSDCTPEWLIAENRANLEGCQLHGCPYYLIDRDYDIPLELVLGQSLS
jgi:gluconate kinase